MNILSLFDGKSGAMAALDYLNVKVDNYYACEIDKYAQQVSRYHYPDIIRLGDVTKVVAKDLPKIDILFAGYPCQAFSFAGKQLNFDDPRGKLFFEVVRLLNELQPRFFLLENVRMKKDIEEEINKLVGVKPVLINSALLGSQNRLRNYWCGGYKNGKVYQIEIIQPTDKGIYLKDIIEYGESDRDKSQTVLSTIWKENAKSMVQRNKKGLIVKVTNINQSSKGEGIKITDNLAIIQRSRGFNKGGIFTEKAPTLSSNSWQDNNKLCIQVGEADLNGHDSLKRVYSLNGKAPTLTTMQGGHQEPKVSEDYVTWRKLTPVECERLQNYPDNYTALGIDDKGNQVKISNSQRYKMLGNGFDRLTVAHCLKQILES